MLNKAFLLAAASGMQEGSSELQPYTRFEMTVQDFGGGACGFSEAQDSPTGNYVHLDGEPIYVPVNGQMGVYFLNFFGAVLLGIPLAENAQGVVRVVNETTGLTVYGVYTGQKILSSPYDCLVGFSTYENACKALTDPSQSYDGVLLFTADDIGRELTIAIYIEDV